MAQYATISRGMQNGLQIFTEKVGADGESQTVQRDPLYADNALLPIEHANRVGDKILAYMTDVTASTSKSGLISITVKARAPATLWSQQVLAHRKDKPTNDFEAKAVGAYLHACE
eukprot:10201-Heterococcus_DN1.PRE.1